MITEVSDALMMDADENEELAKKHALQSEKLVAAFKKERLKAATRLATEG
eukprot:COSAG02_NODE_399_length_23112_cov_1107.712349_12_plen_50_part_00